MSNVSSKSFPLVHKRSVKVLKINNKKIEDETVRSVNVFFVTYVMIFISSLLIISLDNFDFTTNFSAIATTLNDVGPGLGIVGPTGNFSSSPTYLNLSLCLICWPED